MKDVIGLLIVAALALIFAALCDITQEIRGVRDALRPVPTKEASK